MIIRKGTAKHQRCYSNNNVGLYPDKKRKILFLLNAESVPPATAGLLSSVLFETKTVKFKPLRNEENGGNHS
jgi:hypothetical protein